MAFLQDVVAGFLEVAKAGGVVRMDGGGQGGEAPGDLVFKGITCRGLEFLHTRAKTVIYIQRFCVFLILPCAIVQSAYMIELSGI